MAQKENNPGVFGRGGLLDKIFFRSKLVPDNIKSDMADAAVSIAKGIIIVDGVTINIKGPGISSEDIMAYEASVAELSTRHFFADSASNDELTKMAFRKHRELLEHLRVKQESAVSDMESGVPRRSIPSDTALNYQKRRDNKRKEADKTRAKNANANKPWYKRNYDE